MKNSGNRIIDYTCAKCGQEHPRDNLRVKRVSFATLGRGGKVVRSRAVGFLCPTCLLEDPAWQAKAFFDAPGLRDVNAPEG